MKYQKTLTFDVEEVDEVNYIIRGVFSTSANDRHGEIVDQTGWKLDEFLANPVILFAHDQYQPAVGQAVEISTETGQLEGAIKFAVEEYEFAATLFKLYAGKYMRAFSVGFENNRYEIDQDNEQVILRENTLYEISCVNVPANSLALAKSKGIDVSVLEKKEARAHKLTQKLLGKTLDNDEDKGDNEINEEKALEFFKSQPSESLKSVIATLTAIVKADEGVATTPNDKRSNKKAVKKSINRAIRTLLKEKKLLAEN